MKRAVFSIFLAVVLLGNIVSPARAGLFDDLIPEFQEGLAAYERGDYVTALEKFRPLAIRGIAGAQFYLGLMYSNGQGVSEDSAEAVKWYSKAAEQGEASAQFNLGLMYKNGGGVPQDYIEAARWYRLAAKQGHAWAQLVLALMYANGEGVPQDYSKAVKWYRKAAEQGNYGAQSDLGVMYAEGRGVPRNYEEAVKWFRKAAEQGDASAQTNLGVRYANGEGVPRDHAEAVRWFRKAAERGLDSAQFNLGLMYNEGKGVLQDYVEAVKWFRKAAEQGYADAQYNLGLMYVNGIGVPQDYVQAHMWWNLAAVAGGKYAIENRDRVAQDMTPTQLAEAQRLAREWRPAASQDDGSNSTAIEPRTSSPSKLKLYATGTGFIVSRSGHVLTNDHVVNGCREVRVPPATVVENVATDPQTDLALLKISGVPLTPATFRQGRGIRPGDPVVVVGFPLQGVLTSDLNVTTGNVSALAGPGNDRRLMQVTAPVQPGNSGGPLLDLSGNIVGVVVSKLDAMKLAELTGDIPQNVNFVISAGVARAFLDAYGVPYETANSDEQLAPAVVADRARGFTLLIECWK